MTKKALTKLKRKLKLYWHIHHETLLEAATEPIKNRKDYIKSHKDSSEHRVRFHCLKPVKRPDLLPPKIIKAATIRAEHIAKKVAPWDMPSIVELVGKGGIEYSTIRKGSMMAKIMARHRREYPKCVCSSNGRLIFP